MLNYLRIAVTALSLTPLSRSFIRCLYKVAAALVSPLQGSLMFAWQLPRAAPRRRGFALGYRITAFQASSIKRRFSLRTLLIATTLVAVVLGIVVAAR